MVVYKRSQSSQQSSEPYSSYESSGLSVGYGDSPYKSTTYFSDQAYSAFSGLPSSYHDKKKRLNKTLIDHILPIMKNLGVFNFVQLLVILFLLRSNYQKNNKLKVTTNELQEVNADLMETLEHLDEFEHDLDVAHTELKRMHKLMVLHEGEYEHNEEEYWLHHEETVDISTDVIAKHNAQEERISQLQKSIQEIHRKELERRFGQGPYYVEFEITMNGGKKYFTVETAPNSMMPHTVYYFMDLIDRKLWDNTLFVHEWDHIVQAVPVSHGINFRDDMGELAFPEYANDFEHGEYTLGMSGRPGGPEFYINVQDNSDYHGPGGQPHSTILNDADPCFAKVVSGRAIIDEMTMISAETVHGVSDTVEEKNVLTSIDSVRIINMSEERRKRLERLH